MKTIFNRMMVFITVLISSINLYSQDTAGLDSPQLDWIDGVGYVFTVDGEAIVCKVPHTKEKIVIPSIVSKNGKQYVATEIYDGAFFEYDHINGKKTNAIIKEIVLPNTINKIGNHAFSGCRNLVSINIPNEVTEIGCDAFYRCLSLKSIILPEGLKRINSSMFEGCHSLETIVIPSTVEFIDEWAFNACHKLKTVELKNPNTIIHENAFYAFADIEIKNWNGNSYIKPKVTVGLYMKNGHKFTVESDKIELWFGSKEEAAKYYIGEYEE